MGDGGSSSHRVAGEQTPCRVSTGARQTQRVHIARRVSRGHSQRSGCTWLAAMIQHPSCSRSTCHMHTRMIYHHTQSPGFQPPMGKTSPCHAGARATCGPPDRLEPCDISMFCVTDWITRSVVVLTVWLMTVSAVTSTINLTQRSISWKSASELIACSRSKWVPTGRESVKRAAATATPR